MIKAEAEGKNNNSKRLIEKITQQMSVKYHWSKRPEECSANEFHDAFWLGMKRYPAMGDGLESEARHALCSDE